jgi:hypothetical protein
MKKRTCLSLLLASIGLLLLGVGYLSSIVVGDDAKAQATQDVEATLTADYGEVARAAITNFEMNWMSLAVHLDPSLQSKLATGPYLWYMGMARDQDSQTRGDWLVTKSATTTYWRVIEYTPMQFKAVARVTESVDELTPKEEFVRSLPVQRYCRLYLFVQDAGTWKVAVLFDMSVDRDVERDWENEVAWEKLYLGRQVLGDLPAQRCPATN